MTVSVLQGQHVAAPARPPLASITSPRIIIVDTHALMREGISSRIRAGLPGATVVYQGQSLHAAVDAAASRGCDLAIVGTQRDGTFTELEAASAFAVHRTPTVVLVERPSVQGMEGVLVAGAAGYVGKDCDADEFTRALETVLRGGSWAPIAGMYRTGPKSAHVQLSEQERRALVLYASGMTRDAVGRRMGIKPSTVKYYIDRVRGKYSDVGVPARTKLELHAIARIEGFLA